LLNKEDVPQQLAVTITDDALNSVPAESAEEEVEFTVPLHPKATIATPFQFFELDWNPHGHPPAGIYDKPHFDIHTYMVTKDEVMTYTDPAKLNAAPADGYLPPHYAGGQAVPQMGRHWMDVTAPEFNGQPFTQTFIYGTYDGQVKFYEPMITLDFLKNTTSFERTIPQPAKFQKAGYYPTKLHIIKHDGLTEIVYDGFSYKQAS
jgi:hypothetical protein